MLYKKVYKKKEIILYGWIIAISVFSYICYLIFYLNFEQSKDYTSYVFLLSWIGIFIFIYVFYTWYKITGRIFSLYTLFILFFFLFNYGQPIIWAIGIHQPDEIGNLGLYTLDRSEEHTTEIQ